MKFKLLILFCLPIFVFAQPIQREDLIGNWKSISTKEHKMLDMIYRISQDRLILSGYDPFDIRIDTTWNILNDTLVYGDNHRPVKFKGDTLVMFDDISFIKFKDNHEVPKLLNRIWVNDYGTETIQLKDGQFIQTILWLNSGESPYKYSDGYIFMPGERRNYRYSIDKLTNDSLVFGDPLFMNFSPLNNMHSIDIKRVCNLLINQKFSIEMYNGKNIYEFQDSLVLVNDEKLLWSLHEFANNVFIQVHNDVFKIKNLKKKRIDVVHFEISEGMSYMPFFEEKSFIRTKGNFIPEFKLENEKDNKLSYIQDYKSEENLVIKEPIDSFTIGYINTGIDFLLTSRINNSISQIDTVNIENYILSENKGLERRDKDFKYVPFDTKLIFSTVTDKNGDIRVVTQHINNNTKNSYFNERGLVIYKTTLNYVYSKDTKEQLYEIVEESYDNGVLQHRVYKLFDSKKSEIDSKKTSIEGRKYFDNFDNVEDFKKLYGLSKN